MKVFSLEGEQLGTIRYYPSFMAQKIGPVSCLAFHPYEVLLAAGAADASASIYTEWNMIGLISLPFVLEGSASGWNFNHNSAVEDYHRCY